MATHTPSKTPDTTKPPVASRPNGHKAAQILAPGTARAPRFDTSSKAYKKAVSKYTRFMIAMPVLIVTSYYLFDRLALGNEAKTFETSKAKNTGK